MSSSDIVQAWFRDLLATGPIARTTPCYNQLFEAIPGLIARLDAEAPTVTAPDGNSEAADDNTGGSEGQPETLPQN